MSTPLQPRIKVESVTPARIMEGTFSLLKKRNKNKTWYVYRED